jgi:hypothetical protein
MRELSITRSILGLICVNHPPEVEVICFSLTNTRVGRSLDRLLSKTQTAFDQTDAGTIRELSNAS